MILNKAIVSTLKSSVQCLFGLTTRGRKGSLNEKEPKIKVRRSCCPWLDADEKKPENDVMKLETCAACIDESTLFAHQGKAETESLNEWKERNKSSGH